jgi:exonuclease III
MAYPASGDQNESYVIKELQEICKERGLSFVHQNICGLQTKFESLCAVVETHNIDVITLSETHLSQTDCHVGLYSINGYELLTRNRTIGKGGGICIYIKNGINWIRRNDLDKKNIESLWVEIFFKNSHSILICCMYRPPETSKYLSTEFNNEFNNILQSLTKETILMGDCNVNYANKGDNREFKSILSLNGFNQLIKQPTRIT